MYGTAYGIFFLVLSDVIAYLKFIFGKENLNLDKPYLLPAKNNGTQFLNFCLLGDNNNYKSKINSIISSSLNNFFINYKELSDLFSDDNKPRVADENNREFNQRRSG